MSSSSKTGETGPAAEAKKFLFDTNDFSVQKTRANTPIYTEEQLQIAREQAFALGKAEGLKDARQTQEERLLDLAQKIIAVAGRLAEAEDRREVEKCADAVKLAMRVTHKLMPQLAQEHALPEIERVILQAIEARKDEPRIAVVVPTAHLDILKAKVDALALEKGYAGKVILLADDALAATDCRVEWADGGAERLYERLFSLVDSEFAKALAGMDATLEQEKK